MSRGWAKTSACHLQVSLSCAVLGQIVSLQYLTRSSLRRLADLPCRMFLSLLLYGLQVVTGDVHRSSLRRLICSGSFHFIHIADYVYDFCSLPDPDVGLSILVCDVQHTSFHFAPCRFPGKLLLFCSVNVLWVVRRKGYFLHTYQHIGSQ